MAKIIAVANQKGGVGKTTTAVNLTASLKAAEQNVLLIDLDPQGSATLACGMDKHNLVWSTNDVLLQDCTFEQACLQAGNGFDLLPANSDLTVAEVTLMSKEQRESFLLQALRPVLTRYDYIIIDCPPALNTLTLNAFMASDSVLIPMQCEYLAMEGLVALLDTIKQVQHALNPRLKLEGILRTMYDARSRLCADVSKQLLTHFADKVYRTTIPRNVRLAEAPSHGLTAIQYDKNSNGAAAYMVFASELIKRQEVTV
ncbi:MAG: ParA family protein [Legionellales bacterium]|nr:ParA family protein [Legionellales bacterium]